MGEGLVVVCTSRGRRSLLFTPFLEDFIMEAPPFESVPAAFTQGEKAAFCSSLSWDGVEFGMLNMYVRMEEPAKEEKYRYAIQLL